MSTIQCRSFYLLIVALLFIGSRGAAQATAADQNFKTIPQQVKTNAEVKATNKTNSVANSATDKVDSGLNKAYKGFTGMFKKKKKKDSVGATPPPPPPPGGTPPPPGGTPPPPGGTPPPPGGTPPPPPTHQISMNDKNVPVWARKTAQQSKTA
jgi:hypothetical protein